MPIDQIQNGESGLSIRTKLNQTIDYVNADSSSYADTSSYSLSSSYALSSSYSGTSSYALSSSYSDTSSYLNNLYQDITIYGNVNVEGTASITYLNVAYESSSIIYSSGSNQFGDEVNDIQTLIGQTTISGSLKITGSISTTDSINSPGLVGSSSFIKYGTFTTNTSNYTIFEKQYPSGSGIYFDVIVVCSSGGAYAGKATFEGYMLGLNETLYQTSINADKIGLQNSNIFINPTLLSSGSFLLYVSGSNLGLVNYSYRLEIIEALS